MGDMGDMYNAMRAHGKERRTSNRATTPEVLQAHGVEFTSHNHGAHLVVTHGGRVADLWPGTGKYNIRGVKRYRRGVFNLLRELGIERKEPRHAANNVKKYTITAEHIEDREPCTVCLDKNCNGECCNDL